jgi:hypothetical protein
VSQQGEQGWYIRTEDGGKARHSKALKWDRHDDGSSPLLSAAQQAKARAAKTTGKTSVKVVVTYVVRNGDAMLHR